MGRIKHAILSDLADFLEGEGYTIERYPGARGTICGVGVMEQQDFGDDVCKLFIGVSGASLQCTSDKPGTECVLLANPDYKDQILGMAEKYANHR